ncbi:MAG TPA: hypothetical protein VFG14_09800, partial [Chthoniobacteraceae bacterium]|nr:hypothetical protein [Chthoniobacteraceae bacterium]
VIKGKTMEELRTIARDELQRQKTNDSESGKRADIMREILSKVECELPTGLVRSRTQGIVNEIVKENSARGINEELLRQNEKDIVGTATASAREQIKGTFVLLRIAEKEGLTVKREELLGRVASLAQRYQMSFEKMAKELEKRNALDQIHEEMLTAKALDFLVANASVTTAPVAQAAS